MRFKADLQNANTFSKLVASVASLGPIAWIKLDEENMGLSVVPEKGSQVWATIPIDAIFADSYTIQSNAENTINLEVALQPLLRALQSAVGSQTSSIRLTKKNDRAILSLTIRRSYSVSIPGAGPVGPLNQFADLGSQDGPEQDAAGGRARSSMTPYDGLRGGKRDREVVIVQEVPVRVMTPAIVEALHRPICRDPDVHIALPPLGQLKAVSDRYTRLAMNPHGKGDNALPGQPFSFNRSLSTFGTGGTAGGDPGVGVGGVGNPKLELSANMQGCLRLRLALGSVQVQTIWKRLINPELDPDVLEGGDEAVRTHPSTRMKELGDPDGQSEDGWATVRIDGKDWGKVLSVGRMGGRVIACFCHNHALVLYVYLTDDEGENDSVVTYFVGSYSE